MSMNRSSRQPIEPLTVGNVVSTGLRLYRSHLKPYFSVAVFATLWIVLPFLLFIPLIFLFVTQTLGLSALWLIIPLWLLIFLYCLSQYLTNSALISRLGFGELIDKPETANTGRSQLNRRNWSFLFQGIVVSILLFAFYIICGIISFIIAGILGIALTFVNPVFGTIVSVVISVFIILLGMSWFYSRLWLAEVVLAVEEGSQVIPSIGRSWELTQTSAFRIQGVFLVTFLVTLPIVLVTGYLPQIPLISMEQGSAAYWTLYIISLVLSFAGGAVTMPFWQAIKAVVYYDVRSRREGLGLQLRDWQSP
ncbi:hypothetical protein [Allocoleopsis franciscana]|uniref:Glycerophosphoryl diester phosphodiesterase membrane domain-containing protein n=1 Tax=Allocoleopsis franciscana PCC 7113 TaxID=1173027 RepID=K9WDJ2_9CYAN|nr:hypothetical protein [Allocoleopsis franciscana]AFZ18303.1 hypothetical protein Mic7113_2503 [Allocoleopsis franciscana PCC 7113]